MSRRRVSLQGSRLVGAQPPDGAHGQRGELGRDRHAKDGRVSGGGEARRGRKRPKVCTGTPSAT